MSGGAAPYLYNLETKKTTPLVPADEETEEFLRDSILMRNALAVKATQEQISAMRERLAKMKGRELTAELCSDTGRIAPLRRVTNSFYTRENYLVFADNVLTAMMLIDCSTGRYYCSRENSVTPCGIRDGKLLYYNNMVPVLKLLDIENGKTEEIQLGVSSLFPDGARLRAAAFLPDGSLCAVLADMKLDQEAGENCALVVSSPDGKTENWPLGKIRYSWEPDTILAAGTDCIIVYSRLATRVSAPYLVRRTAGEVLRLISAEDGLVQLLSAGITMIPYMLITHSFDSFPTDPVTLLLLLVVGLVHTGITYVLYFGSMEHLRTQTVAILGYIDPVSALFFSAILLKEPLSMYNIIGAVLIIGSALISEI